MKNLAMFSVLVIIILSSCGPSPNHQRQKAEIELGSIISEMSYGDIISVSSATHQYLFSSLEEGAARTPYVDWKKGIVQFGFRLYYMRNIENGYALEPYDGKDQFEYHLIITQKSYQINPAGYYLNNLIIEKRSGGYYNKK